MRKLREIFDVSYGTKMDFNKLEVCDSTFCDGINFVSRTSQNNGIVAKVKRIENKKPLGKGQITVSLGGSYVLSAFLQIEEFYTAQNVAVLKPIESLSERELFYYCMCITKNRFRYGAFGREANSTLKDLLLPSKEEIPNRLSTTKIPDYSDIKEPLDDDKKDFKQESWGDFELGNLFNIRGTKTTKKDKLEEIGIGEYPYITTQSTNNGTGGFYDVFTENGRVLTIDSAVTGYCSYQEKNFSASDHVEQLIPNFQINKFIGLFLTTIINKEKYRYSYGRKYNQERIKSTKIKLPVDSSGNPDRKFMENYIKSLPYSKYL